jgi:hypothetical protein
MHDATKVLLGTTKDSFKVVDNKAGTLEAGVVACAKSDGTYTTASADGASVGVSLGKSLSDTDRFALVREGTGVPILKGTGTPVVGAQVAVSNTTGKTVDYTGSGNRYVNAYYREVGLTGIKEDGTEADCSIIDFPGGL